MTPQQEESDQLPEEQPSSAVTEDTPDKARDEAEGSAGAADEDGDEREGQNTGSPTNAG
jgi:hypothetical protein